MEIKQYNSNPSFGKLHVTQSADKVLKNVDRLIRKPTIVFTEYYQPKGHKKPLWSVLKKEITERQENNKNNILIDVIVEKGKKLLSVITQDRKGYVQSQRVVKPVEIGSYNDLFMTDEFLTYNRYFHSFDKKTYGKSDFFEAVCDAEDLVNELHAADTKVKNAKKVSQKLLPKQKWRNERKAEMAAAKKKELEKAQVTPHIHRPFESLSVSRALFNEKTEKPVGKITAKQKERLPRKAKKSMKK